MLREFKFPDVGEGIAEGEIVRWLAKEGDWIKEDQDLVEVETDKAVITLNSPFSGKIAKLHAQEGDLIKVGALLTTVQDGQENSPPAPEQTGSVTVVGSLGEEKDVEAIRPILAAPAVRALAKQINLDLSGLKGSGPGGRITREDVEVAARNLAPAPSAATDTYGQVEKVPLRGLRRTLAKRMAEASKRVAEVTIWEDADITELEQVRAEKRKRAEAEGVKLTYLPFLIKASIAALKAHPYLNATLDEAAGEIVLRKYYNIGIAVDTPDGLIVFVIKHADQKNILDLAREGTALAEKARQRRINLPELRGSTFTITSIGGIGGLISGPGGLLGQGGLLNLQKSRAGANDNPTGLSAQQERDLLGLLLGGQ